MKFLSIRLLLLSFSICLVANVFAAEVDPTAPHPLVEPALVEIAEGVAQGPFEPNWESLSEYEIPQWYRDAKFGIFIHWGVYSVPAHASEWYPRKMYIEGKKGGSGVFQHHIAEHGPQKDFGYKDFIPDFKGEKFDPVAWAKLFKDSGARYVIPVAEHHDGFPMYDCSYTEWDASEMGPKRDIVAELSEAVRDAGMKFGVSSHRAFNWNYYVRDESFDNADPKYARLYGRPLQFLFQDNAWDYRNFMPPHDQQFKDDWLARSCEIVDKYQPDVFWFDFGIGTRSHDSYKDNPFAEHLQRFAAYYYNKTSGRPDGLGVINYKFNAFPESAAVYDKERSKMAEIRRPFWQTDTAVSLSSWGYTENQDYKTADRLIDDLVDIVSKNGCLLLNVGPRPDGTIPEEDQAILLEIGKWLQQNGEAIYNTTCWKVYGEGSTKVSTAHVSEKSDKAFNAEDLRFTTNDGYLYVFGLAWPENNQVIVKSLGEEAGLLDGEIGSVEMLGQQGALEFTREAGGLVVQLPAEAQTEYAYVLKIEL